MRGAVALGVAAWLAAGLAQAAAPDAEAQVRRLVERESRMYGTLDASTAREVYASDIRWQNPFGVRFQNEAELEIFLKRLFARPSFRSAQEVSPTRITDIRILGPNAAIAWSFEASQGQTRPDGSAVGLRKSHILYGLQRRQGRWWITDEMIMDERE